LLYTKLATSTQDVATGAWVLWMIKGFRFGCRYIPSPQPQLYASAFQKTFSFWLWVRVSRVLNPEVRIISLLITYGAPGSRKGYRLSKNFQLSPLYCTSFPFNLNPTYLLQLAAAQLSDVWLPKLRKCDWVISICHFDLSLNKR
jgi:hypothetical protein